MKLIFTMFNIILDLRISIYGKSVNRYSVILFVISRIHFVFYYLTVKAIKLILYLEHLTTLSHFEYTI